LPFNDSGSLGKSSTFKPNTTTLVQRIIEDDNGTEIIVEEEEEEEIVSLPGDHHDEDDKAQAIIQKANISQKFIPTQARASPPLVNSGWMTAE
jgi:hypothetical protein